MKNMKKITAKQIAKEIKGLSVGVDRIEIIVRTAKLIEEASGETFNPEDIYMTMEKACECEGYYNIAMAALEDERKNNSNR